MSLSWRGLIREIEGQGLSRGDVRRLVERASGYERAELLTRLDEPVSDRAAAFVDSLVARRRAGEPLQYVLGRWGFRGLDLFIDRRVLIPRPETEMVVEVALETLGPGPRVVADLGTGSGAIALSMAAERPDIDVWATDASGEALAVARANLAGTGTSVGTRVQLREGEWFAALPGELRGGVDLVVSNPPYVGEAENLPPEVAQWEPHSALVAGPRGTEAIEALLADAPPWLAQGGGALVMEIAPHQAETATMMARAAGFGSVAVRPDLNGRPRALVARLH